MNRFTRIFIVVAILALPVLAMGQAGPGGAHTAMGHQGISLVNILRGMLGIAVVIGLGFLLSDNRRAINWRIIGVGLAIQVVIALAVLKVPVVMYFFEFVGKLFIKVLDSSNAGSDFLFKSFVSNQMEVGLINFAFRILPTIIFFSALTSVLFYYGIIQKVVYGLAWLLTKALRVSGAESLSAASNIFLGQTEAPLLVKEYLEKMNKSEIMLVMVGGMATIAGGVLAVYIGLLGGDDPQGRLLFAKHLITASVMAAPGAIIMSKLLVPQTQPILSEIKITREKVGANILDAIANGTGQGIRLAVNVAAMLIVFIAFVYLVNFILMKVGDWTSLNRLIVSVTNGQYQHFSLQFALGYALAPLMWLLGVGGQDITYVGQLFGEKIILNEMIAYISLRDLLQMGVFTDQKSIIMVTYMLCGFANVGSVGIQLGGIGALAPGQRLNLSKLGFKSLLGGGMASLLSATIIGMLIG